MSELRTASIEPFLLHRSSQALHCVYWPACAPALRERAVILLPALADEMNKGRRMFALLARSLQKLGIATLCVDLTGTGDSAGDFRDATLEDWRLDLQAGLEWLAARGHVEISAVAMRGGALLAGLLEAPAQQRFGRLALWQPVASGRTMISQFLRLRLAEAIAGSDRNGIDARRELESSGSVEVAGYELTRVLAEALERLDLHAIVRQPWLRVAWFEVQGSELIAPSPAAERMVRGLAAEGCRIELHSMNGEPFWTTPEIAVVPEMIACTTDFLVDSK